MSPRAQPKRRAGGPKTTVCRNGHDKPHGKRCDICQREHQRESARRASKRKRGGSPVFGSMMPLQPRLMKVLEACYGREAVMLDDIAADKNLDAESARIAAGRLRGLGLIKTEKRYLPHPETGAQVNYAFHSLTASGVVLVQAWREFRRKLGPVAKTLKLEAAA